MCMSTYVFKKIRIYKWAKHGLATMSLSQKDCSWSGNIDSPVKKMLLALESVTKVMLTVF